MATWDFRNDDGPFDFNDYLDNPFNATITASSPTFINLIENVGNGNFEFLGFGFTFSGQTVTGGTVTTIDVFEGVVKTGSITNISISAVQLFDFFINVDNLGLQAALFSGNDTIFGGAFDPGGHTSGGLYQQRQPHGPNR